VAFVLAIVSLVQQRIAGGIVLMIGLFIAYPVSIVTMIAATKSRVDHAHAVRQQEHQEQGKERLEALAVKHRAEKAEAQETPEPTLSRRSQAEADSSLDTVEVPLPQIIALRQSVSIQLPYGTTILPAGTRIQLVGRKGETIQIRYMDADYEIPISATDLK
jgi:hypothetical protein